MRVVITGGSSGLGAELAKKIQEWPASEEDVHVEIWCDLSEAFSFSRFSKQPEKTYMWEKKSSVDVRDEESVNAAARSLEGKVDILVNAAGVNHLEWFEKLSVWNWNYVMDTNAKGLWLTSKALINAKKFNRPATICNIVSNASHMPMTHSVAYNASKGAAHIMTLQMARELKKTHDITVFGVSPNKMAGTMMSKEIEERVCKLRGWTPEQAAEYQKAALPAGEETPPEAVAEFLAFLLSSRDRHKYLNGCVIPYGA